MTQNLTQTKSVWFNWPTLKSEINYPHIFISILKRQQCVSS